MNKQISFFTLLLMISFASVTAVLFTPALPNLVKYFHITESEAQLTVTIFLIGYALGVLIYGPLANRFGRKNALYMGVGMQILSNLFCVLSGPTHFYSLLLPARFLMALGSSVGLKMAFTLVNETNEMTKASQTISYLLIASAIAPGLGVMISGILLEYFSWRSVFWFGAFYGVLLMVLIIRIPETIKELDVNALNTKSLLINYYNQFSNSKLLVSGFLMGGASSFIYLFAAIAPFVAMELMHMNPSVYGQANLLPPIGLILGSLASARLVTCYKIQKIIRAGISLAFISSVSMFFMMKNNLGMIPSFFAPMILCYFGLALVFANASSFAMKSITDKSYGSAAMNFINMGFVTIMVLTMSNFKISVLTLPSIFMVLCTGMFILAEVCFVNLNEKKIRQGVNLEEN